MAEGSAATPPPILISAGEASGDAHGASLARALARLQPGAQLFGVAGAGMREAGVEAVARVEDIAVMGFVEVVCHLLRLWRTFRAVVREARQRRPGLAVLIDAPDFHLRLARRLHQLGVPVVYFIGPQLWAWRPGRVRTILRWVRRMLVIFPFEREFYRQHGVAVEFVGHPFLDRAPLPPPAAFRAAQGLAPDRRLVALLPGSRRSEVARHLPVLLAAAERVAREHRETTFVLPVAPTLEPEDLERRCAGSDLDLRILTGPAAEMLAACDAAAVASGTATLEAALAGAPMVVLYRTSWLSSWIARALVRVPFIGMANLILGRAAAPELIQGQASPTRLAAELQQLLEDPERAATQRRAWAEVRTRLGQPGAVERAAVAALGVYGERG